MSSLIELVKSAKADGNPGAMDTAYPYAVYLGLQGSLLDDQLVYSLPFDNKIVGNPLLPAIHGGVVGAFLESVALMTLMWELDVVQLPKTIDITFDYLRSAGPKTTWAKAILTKRGRRVANVRVEAWQDDPQKPVAAAHGNFLTG
ncbi:MAG: PaaI family thioesterase [Alphaproteobacteria bacterium]|jgi:uncharacterized protein (TIGR00369 family)|nr:PaaI family thioesterase [Alphaproteobacteria bacterium]MBT4020078.1 PaaI family thioesterase [Alphaproteobacteria bacterium]MBT4965358.1 PaaI family thioesterase [Alphaproteobacteria bacterium]MBT5158146.1 PaaI family thioesterase [Alphaproteobacteria bacterium]MBT5919673.1 PaaI family thioesterase [Alphaproteobacteria bacterium]